MPEHPVIDAAQRFRAQALAREREAANRLVQTYGRAYTRFGESIETLSSVVSKLDDPDRADVVRLSALRSLRQQVETEVTRFAVYADTEISRAATAAIQAGLSDSRALATAAMGGTGPGARALIAGWDMLPVESVETMLGFLANDSPLHSALVKRLGPAVAERMSDALVDGIVLGMNPRRVAEIVRKELGVGLTWALTTARTAQLNAYREASRANYVANSHIVESWTWLSALGNRTCFPAGTMVTTQTGNVPIEKIAEGDFVLTHTGKYRRVTETMRRVYSGKMIEITAGNKRVVCTPEHPLLIQRQGQLDWVEARNVRLTDSVICQVEGSPNQFDHAFREVAIQSRVGDTDNSIPSGLHPQSLSGIPLLDGFTAVPVCAVNFQNGIEVGQKEVHGISPTGESVFLQESNTDSFQAQPGVFFGSGFAGVAPITTSRTEDLIDGRDGSKIFAASLAFFDNWRSSAFFGTIMPSMPWRSVEDFSATFAGNVFACNSFAIHTAMDLFGIGCGYNKIIFAFGTSFGNTGSSQLARLCTKALLAIVRGFEWVIAELADSFDRWLGLSAFPTVWMLPLVHTVAFGGAEFPFSLFDGSALNGKFFTTLQTGMNDLFVGCIAPPFASAIGTAKSVFLFPIGYVNKRLFPASVTRSYELSSYAGNVNFVHGLPLSFINNDIGIIPQTTVYNIEVEEDHSYVANGLVVHNCMSCLNMHGSFHPVTESLNDHHNGRCVAIPNVKQAKAFGLPQPEIEPGQQWFERQSEAFQRERMGPGMFDAWKAGKFDFRDLSVPYDDPVYGEMLRESTLVGLLGKDAKRYYRRL